MPTINTFYFKFYFFFIFFFLYIEFSKNLTCSDECETCEQEPEDGNTHCLSCKNNLYLNNGNCVTECPFGRGRSITEEKKCIQCNSNCDICSGESNDDLNQKCITCFGGYQLNTINNNCVKCSDEQYKLIEIKMKSFLNKSNLYYYNKTFCMDNKSFIDCPIEMPILRINEKICSSFPCNNDEYENEICQISNHIIKVQYFDEIINSPIDNIQYTYTTKDNKGNLFILSESTKKRAIFGLKPSGNYYLYDVPFLTINSNGSIYENWGQFITVDVNNITYFLFFYDNFFEIFIPERLSMTTISMKQFLRLDSQNIGLGKEVSHSYQLKSSPNSFLFYHFFNTSDNICHLSISKYEISEENISFKLMSKNYTVLYIERFVDCYETENRIIICAFINEQFKIQIEILDYDLKRQTDENIYLYDNDGDFALSFKAIHFKKEIGIFLFLNHEDYFENVRIILKNLIIKNGKYYFEAYKDLIKINVTKFNEYGIEYYRRSYDLVKLSNEKFFCALKCGNGVEIIIIMFMLYNNDNYIKIRYYNINTLLYFYKVTDSLILFNYNNYIGISFTRNKFKNLEYNDAEYEDYKSSIIFFSYLKTTNPEIIKNFQNNFPNYFILNNYTKIINNLFGYILSHYIVDSLPEYNISSFSTLTNSKLSKGDSLNIDDEIFFDFNYTNSSNETIHILEYIPIITESDYDEYDKYSIYSEVHPSNSFNEKNYFKKENYTGQKVQLSFQLGCYKTCKTCEYIGNDNIHKCLECLENYFKIDESLNINISNCYNETPEHFYLDEDLKIYKECDINCKTCSQGPLENNSNCIECMHIDAIPFNGNCIICNDTQSFDEEQNKCVDFNNTKCNLITLSINKSEEELTQEFIQKLLINYKENYYKINNNTIVHYYNTNYSITLQQISHKYKTNSCISNYILNISTVHLDECFERIFGQYNISYNLVNLQLDFKDNSENVNYLLYSPRNNNILDLKICEDMIITIDKYINMDKEQTDKYLDLLSKGYNMFDINDSFYTDVCSTYTTKYGSDIILSDRILDYYNGSIPVEYNNCEYSTFNIETKKITCQTKIETDFFKSIKNLFTTKKNNLFKDFLEVFTDSNISVIKCFSLFFSKKGQTLNYGSYLLMIFIVLFLINTIIFYHKGNKKIVNLLYSLIEKNIIVYNISKKVDDNLNYQKNKKVEEKSREIYNFYKSYFEYLDYKNRNYNFNNKENIDNKSPIKNKSSKNIISNKSNDITIKSSSSRINLEKEISPPQKIEEKTNYQIKRHYIYNDYELNWLDYYEAIEIDKRQYIDYYWATLKRRHLLLFSFYPNEDYNLKEIKISLFIISFTLYFSINTLFFRDNTMHKIYKDQGQINYFYHIPIIIYSSIISSIIRTLLKLLSLSEKPVLELKNCETKIIAKKRAHYLLKKLDLRFIIFYVICFVLLFFFWFYIGCFCCVYINTQIILFKDSLVSFAISMVYPVFICIIPSFLRLFALNDKLERRKIIYKLSQYITLI